MNWYNEFRIIIHKICFIMQELYMITSNRIFHVKAFGFSTRNWMICDELWWSISICSFCIHWYFIQKLIKFFIKISVASHYILIYSTANFKPIFEKTVPSKTTLVHLFHFEFSYNCKRVEITNQLDFRVFVSNSFDPIQISTITQL